MVLRSGGLSPSDSTAPTSPCSAAASGTRAGAWRTRVNSSMPSSPASATPATTHGVRSADPAAAERRSPTPRPQLAQKRAPAVRAPPHREQGAPPRGVPQAEQKFPLPEAPQVAQVVTDGGMILI